MGIFSLSKTVFNELLWAYYTNGHKGFCIEYDFEQLQKSFPDGLLQSTFEVQYNNDTPEFSINSIINYLENDGLFEISPESVTGIYFGLRMSESDKELIKKTLKGRNIKYYQMKLKPNSYLLEAELIN